MPNSDSVVHLFNSHLLAEVAIKELQRMGIDLAKLTIVGRDHKSDEHVVFWVMNARPPMETSPLVASIIVAIEGASPVDGLGAVGAGLFSIGIPNDQIALYESEIKAGKFVLVFHGTNEEVTKARHVLYRGDTRKSNIAVTTPVAAP